MRKCCRIQRLTLMLLCFGIIHRCVQAAIITSVVENSAATSYANPIIVENGFGEDATAFSDRLHQWNSTSTSNALALPTFAGLGLVGQDYVRTSNDARAVPVNSAAYTITLSEDARVFLFLDTRTSEPAWLNAMNFERIATSGTDGHYLVGYDEGQTIEDLGVGVGASINTRAWIYTAKLAAGTHTLNGLGAGNNNYGIVATKANTVVGGVARLTGTTATPTLLRSSLGPATQAFADRAHRWMITESNFNSLSGLRGADLVQMSNDVRGVSATTPLYEVTLLEDSAAYLFLDDRYLATDLGWSWILQKGFSDTGVNIGIDETSDGINEHSVSVYKAFLSKGNHTFYGLENAGLNQYGLAFHAIPEPNRALLLFAGILSLVARRKRSPLTP